MYNTFDVPFDCFGFLTFKFSVLLSLANLRVVVQLT